MIRYRSDLRSATCGYLLEGGLASDEVSATILAERTGGERHLNIAPFHSSPARIDAVEPAWTDRANFKEPRHERRSLPSPHADNAGYEDQRAYRRHCHRHRPCPTRRCPCAEEALRRSGRKRGAGNPRTSTSHPAAVAGCRRVVWRADGRPEPALSGRWFSPD